MPQIVSLEDILETLKTAVLSVADRIAIVRALRDGTPDLVAEDPRIRGRVNAAQAIDAEYAESTVVALENSVAWQRSIDLTPKALNRYLELSTENRPLCEEVTAYAKLLKYNMDYYHFVAIDNARIAHKAAMVIRGEDTKSIQTHLPILAASRGNAGGRKRKKAEEAPSATPTVPPKQ